MKRPLDMKQSAPVRELIFHDAKHRFMCAAHFMRRQVRLIQPKAIVCLGRISAMRLIKPDFKITKEHGQWFEKGNFLITAVYHPALLLRDPRKKEEMLIDMKKIKEKLDEISLTH